MPWAAHVSVRSQWIDSCTVTVFLFYHARLLWRLARAIQPAPAYYIDTKLDDGLPLSGQVRAFDSFVYPTGWYLNGSVATGNPANGPVCLDNTQTPVQYSTASSGFLCGLAIKANF